MSTTQMLGGIFIAVALISLFIPMPSRYIDVATTFTGLLLLFGIILLAVHVWRQPDKADKSSDNA